MYDDWNGPRCICGDDVAVYHKECLALLSPVQYARLMHGKPVGDPDH
jgi:hypothetical protein